MAFNPNYGNRNNNRGGNNYQNRGEAPQSFPDGYLKDLSAGYFQLTDKGERVMNPDFIIGYPEKIAKALFHTKKNKSSQIRKYYDYCIRIRDIMRSGKTYEAVKSEFFRLSNFVAYAESRELVTHLFSEFIDKNLGAIKTKEDFDAFLKHFEAVVAHLKDK